MGSAVTTKIYLVRHGQSAARERNIVQGVGLDIPLTAEGVVQAERVGAALAGITFDKIFTSTALRARDTAAAIRRYHGEVPYEELVNLNERSKGLAEGMTKEAFAAAYPEVLAGWHREEDVRPPGGENFADVHARVVPIIEQHIKDAAPGSTLLYVIHGNVIRVLLGHFLHIPYEKQPRIAQDNGAMNIAVFDHERGRWSVEKMNHIS